MTPFPTVAVAYSHDIRELLPYPCLINYEIKGNDVLVLAMIHRLQEFLAEMAEH